ncbi:uncharacterized protein LOC124881114 [Girardinichthys multiradiatus]|uniref:uncharacterized protein LOC124881114 n=1 Tax=Girardinichthys multiradiatus TaxID=208333 RepID=UPI001FAE1105|nr:uncharacterized protein LOC124881114 [Girardinichthys multiradiatus]
MLLSVLLLLLLVSGSQGSHFLGTMMTYYPKETNADGSVSVILRYKVNYDNWSPLESWVCGGNCGNETQTLALTKVEEVTGEWCQSEGIITRLLPNNTGFETVFAGGNWINNIQNGVSSWRAVTDVELRNRSDIGKPNTSPQTTILPALRVPSNCPRNIDLLAFDPDGDTVKCRYGNTSDSECNPCTPPSVLSLSPSCSLSFSPTNSSTELPYAVQLVMEDFPTQSITLTQTNGLQEVKTTSDAISKIPLQFVLKVGLPVPSCTDGLYLPRFLSPTPDNRAQLYIPVNQALEIPIRAEATASQSTELLYSGPYNVVKTSWGSGNFSLTWRPSVTEAGQSHPICFVAQANVSGTFYHSDLRCVIVTVGNTTFIEAASTAGPLLTTTTPMTLPATPPLVTTVGTVPATPPPVTSPMIAATTPASGPQYVIALDMQISTTLSLENDSDTIITLIKNKLIEKGLPSAITIRLLSSSRVAVTTARP